MKHCDLRSSYARLTMQAYLDSVRMAGSPFFTIVYILHTVSTTSEV